MKRIVICIVLIIGILLAGKYNSLVCNERAFLAKYGDTMSSFVVEKRGLQLSTLRFYEDVRILYRFCKGLDWEVKGRLFEDGTVLTLY